MIDPHHVHALDCAWGCDIPDAHTGATVEPYGDVRANVDPTAGELSDDDEQWDADEGYAVTLAGRLVASLRENPSFARRVASVLDDIERTLIQKNQAYGNSALEPIRVFSKADPVEQLRVRIDDKLSRIQRGTDEFDDEDTVRDLIGYGVLYILAKEDYEEGSDA